MNTDLVSTLTYLKSKIDIVSLEPVQSETPITVKSL